MVGILCSIYIVSWLMTDLGHLTGKLVQSFCPPFCQPCDFSSKFSADVSRLLVNGIAGAAMERAGLNPLTGLADHMMIKSAAADEVKTIWTLLLQ